LINETFVKDISGKMSRIEPREAKQAEVALLVASGRTEGNVGALGNWFRGFMKSAVSSTAEDYLKAVLNPGRYAREGKRRA
jgi:hypothetical protein